MGPARRRFVLVGPEVSEQARLANAEARRTLEAEP
jgi:hypothetical protein